MTRGEPANLKSAVDMVAEVNLCGGRSGENNHASTQRSRMCDVAYLTVRLAESVRQKIVLPDDKREEG